MQIIKVGHIGGGALLHLDNDGISHCKTASRAVHSSCQLTASEAHLVCKRCEAGIIRLMNQNDDDVYRCRGEWARWGREVLGSNMRIMRAFDDRRPLAERESARELIESVERFLRAGVEDSIRLVAPASIVAPIVVDENQMQLQLF